MKHLVETLQYSQKKQFIAWNCIDLLQTVRTQVSQSENIACP